MKKVNIVLSFDDGRKDNYKIAKEILFPNKLTATFNIATGYIDGTISKETIGTKFDPMSIREIEELDSLGFEIACHGDKHLNTIEDIDSSIKKLKVWLSTKEYGFASPHSQLQLKDLENKIEQYKALGIKYIRIEIRNRNGIMKKMCRHLKLPFLYAFGYANAFLSNKDNYILFSIPIKKSTSLKQSIAIVNLAKFLKKDCILMFHSISDKNDELWTWPRKRFIKLCDYLKQDDRINVCTTMELINKYNKDNKD